MFDTPVLPIVILYNWIVTSFSQHDQTNIVVSFAVPLLIFGGLQWYFIGWARSKNLSVFKLIEQLFRRKS